MSTTAKDLIDHLRFQADPAKARVLQNFFKTGPGQYGEGDVFWGLTVPQTRASVKRFRSLPLKDIPLLLKHEVHEVRLAGVLLMVERFPENPDGIFQLYLKQARRINNWDLVDVSVHKIIGAYLEGKDKALLIRLAESENLWERRMAIVATFHEICRGDGRTAFRIAELLLKDKHDLIHKAVGWMLRESGKRCSRQELENFLAAHACRMPRTMLRYALEHFSPERRRYYMSLKPAVVVPKTGKREKK